MKLIVACLLAASLCASAAMVRTAANNSVVVGLSSGAFMTVQMHIAFSADFRGAGVIAGGPFYCAQNSEITATEACMSMPELIDVDNLVDAAKACVSGSVCDNTDNLQDHRVWFWSGTDDTVVNQGVMKKAVTFYENFIPALQLNTTFNYPAEHAWPTDNFGGSCGAFGSPYINNCNFDASYNMLNYLLGGGLKAPVPYLSANVKTLSQSQYVPEGTSVASLAFGPDAYVYAPAACQGKGAVTCRLVVAFHGCQQTLADIGYDFIAHVGLNEVAEANNLVILYPQAVKSYFDPTNPEGCFDWWGFTDSNYSNKEGPQMATVKNMMDALAVGVSLA